jgi:N-acetylmuramoyl-L-alanine amidase
LTLTVAAWAGLARGAVIGLERVVVSGEEYVRVGEWAEKDDLKMVWRKKEDPILVSNKTVSIRLACDSHRAQINGVNVSLCLPVVNRSGVPWIAMADVEKTLEPTLFPQKTAARVRTICLDPGHGGSDPGESTGENHEKKYTLLLAQAVAKALQAEGFKVVLTRTNDVYVDLKERPARAARAGADLFVSLHYNSGGPSLRGVEVHCLAPEGMNSSNAGAGTGNYPAYPGNAKDDRNVLLAYLMQKSLTKSLGLDDLSVKRGHLEVLREATMPAILIEGGFMSNPQEAKKIYDSDFRQRMARSIADGILAYKNATEEAEVSALRAPVGAARGQGRN